MVGVKVRVGPVLGLWPLRVQAGVLRFDFEFGARIRALERGPG